MNDAPAIRDLVLAELRIAHMRAKSAQEEIAFIGKAYSDGIFTTSEVIEALQGLGWGGCLEPGLMAKLRQACGADVG